MRLFSRAVLLLLLSLTSLSTQAKALQYRLDPVHSRIMFSVSHDGFSNTLGTFSALEGELWFDPKNWADSRVEVRIPLSSLDLGDTAFNARMAKPDYFDSQKHPVARFISTRVEGIDAERAIVHGELSVRGITAPVRLEVRLNRLARSAYTLRRTAGFSATTVIDRTTLGMTAHQRAVGQYIRLHIEVEAVRQRGEDSNSNTSE